MCGRAGSARSSKQEPPSQGPSDKDMPEEEEEEGDREEQLQELEVLQSMYMDDLVIVDEAPIQLELMVALELGCPRRVLAVGRGAPCRQEEEGDDTAEEAYSSEEDPRCGVCLPAQPRESEEFVPRAVRHAEQQLDERDAAAEMQVGGSNTMLSHLPPLTLRVTFCRGYPSRRLPDLQLTAQWLSCAQLAGLCAELDQLAEPLRGQAVVWAWADWLQTSALQFLGLDGATPLVLEVSAAVYDPRALSELDEPYEVLQRLQRFDREHSWWQWQQTAHSCCICLEDKPGTAFCEVGSCGHRFCTECVSGMMEVHISEGTVAAVRCPLPDCRSEVAPRVVRQLVGEKLYQRWRRLQVQKIVSELPTVVYCPRCESNGWETPVLPKEGCGDDELPLAICDRPGCACAFCAACREPYHPNTRCTAMIHRLERLGLQSAAAQAPDKARRQQLAQELESLKFILSQTVPCPKCKMPITRTQGCNHMICSNCTTHFCYRCGTDITTVGYGHFRADKCPTFDREEVQRMQAGAYADGMGEDALEDELQALLEQYPDQANIVWNFRPPAGAWRRHQRKRQVADIACVNCGQWNPRAGTNNHVRCRFCKTNLCYQCRKVIHGTVTHHFKPKGGCPQHSQ